MIAFPLFSISIRPRQSLFSLVLLALAVLFSWEVRGSEEATPIKFAGVWIRGNAQDAGVRCPVGLRYSMANAANQGAKYSRLILQKARKRQKSGGNRLIDRIAPDEYTPQASRGDALVMACAINYEIREQGMLPGGVVGCFAEIGFDLIVCNFSERSIVFSLPCRLVLQDLGKATEAALVKLYEESLPDQFLKLAEYKWNSNQAFNTIGIEGISILQPSNKEGLPANVIDVPKQIAGNIEAVCSQIVGSRFFDETGIALQPFSNGEEAVFYGLQENLADASSLVVQKIREQKKEGVGFVLKKPDYKVTLRGAFIREKQGRHMAYGSQARFILTDAAGKEIYNKVYVETADAIPFSRKANYDVWHYPADACVRMVTAFSKELKKTKKKNEDLSIMFKMCIPR